MFDALRSGVGGLIFICHLIPYNLFVNEIYRSNQEFDYEIYLDSEDFHVLLYSLFSS